MGNFAENLNLGKRVLPPPTCQDVKALQKKIAVNPAIDIFVSPKV